MCIDRGARIGICPGRVPTHGRGVWNRLLSGTGESETGRKEGVAYRNVVLAVERRMRIKARGSVVYSSGLMDTSPRVDRYSPDPSSGRGVMGASCVVREVRR